MTYREKHHEMCRYVTVKLLYDVNILNEKKENVYVSFLPAICFAGINFPVLEM